MRNTLTKILSITTSFALLVTSFTGSANAFGTPATPQVPDFVKTLTPADTLGAVASFNDAGGARMPRLIIISDLHGHIEVQKNISGMLEDYVSRLSSDKNGGSEQRVPIYVEGGWTEHLEWPLRDVSNGRVRSVLADYLFKKAELPAAQQFSERHTGETNFTLTGVENKEEYEANRARFVETYPVRKAVLEALARQERPLSILRSNIENHTFHKLYEMREGYLKGTVSGEDYARTLVRQAGRHGIENSFVRTLRNADANPGDFELALAEVHRRVSESLSGSRPLSSYFRENFHNEALLRKNLAYIDGYLDLLKRTLGDQLTPEEVPYAMAVLPQMIQVAQILLAGQKLGFDVGDAIQRSLDFYPFAFVRDETLVKNSLAALEKDATHATTGILIAGGFHTGAIAQYLKDHRVSYLLVNPIVSRDITSQEQLNYIKRICDEHVTPEEAIDDFTEGGRQLAEGTALAPVVSLTQAYIMANSRVAQQIIPGLAKVVSTFAAGRLPAAVVQRVSQQRTAKLEQAEKAAAQDRQRQITALLNAAQVEFFSADKTPEELLVMHLAPYVDGKKELPEGLRDKVVVTSDIKLFEQGKSGKDGKLWMYIEKPEVSISRESKSTNVLKRLKSAKRLLEENGISGQLDPGAGMSFTLVNGAYALVKNSSEKLAGIEEGIIASYRDHLNKLLRENEGANQNLPNIVHIQGVRNLTTRYATTVSPTRGAHVDTIPHSAMIVNPETKEALIAMNSDDFIKATDVKVTSTKMVNKVEVPVFQNLEALEKEYHELGHFVKNEKTRKSELANTLHSVVDVIKEAARLAEPNAAKMSRDFILTVLRDLNPHGTRVELTALENKLLANSNYKALSAEALRNVVAALIDSGELHEEAVEQMAAVMEHETGLDPAVANQKAEELYSQASVRWAIFANRASGGKNLPPKVAEKSRILGRMVKRILGVFSIQS